MKKDINNGYFLIAASIITPIVTWFLTSNNYKVEIKNIKENSISKEIINEDYIEKNKYLTLRNDLSNTESIVSNDLKLYKNQIDSLNKELRFIRIKCEKISTLPSPEVKIELDNTLLEVEKAYRQGKYIVVDLRITNLGNDKKNYGLDKYKTVIKTDDGMEYEVKKIFKGGKKSYYITGDIFNKEDVLYSLYCGDISSQLNYNKITFRSITSDKTPILTKVSITN